MILEELKSLIYYILIVVTILYYLNKIVTNKDKIYKQEIRKKEKEIKDILIGLRKRILKCEVFRGHPMFSNRLLVMVRFNTTSEKKVREVLNKPRFVLNKKKLDNLHDELWGINQINNNKKIKKLLKKQFDYLEKVDLIDYNVNSEKSKMLYDLHEEIIKDLDYLLKSKLL